MGLTHILTALKERLAGRPDTEHQQAIARLVFVSCVFVYFFSDYYATTVDAITRQYAHLLAYISMPCTLAIFADILLRPGVSVIRRFVGMGHDVAAISLALYFGEGAGAAVGVLYLWITIGNGFRYGVAYLYACFLLCVTGFGLVYTSSDYWQQQPLLSLNLMLALVVVSPYVGSLLKTLHAAKDALQHQASTDVLTGLLSRLEIESSIDSLFDGDAGGHVLLFCDLDRFKEVNDVAGHAAGDKLLTDIGKIIRKSVRRDDLCGRMGGDEFCVLLRNCSLEKGREVAESIRSRTTGYRLAWGTQFFSVGMSIGVAPSDAVGDPESFFRLADAACYAAKNAGRNQVYIVDPRVDELDTQKIRLMHEDQTRQYETLESQGGTDTQAQPG